MRRYTEQTTSECWIEATVQVDDGHSATIRSAWLCYDPDPHGDIEKRDERLVRVSIAPNAIGKAEADHLVEQALESDYDAT